MTLQKYKEKRNLTRSKEPAARVKKGEGPLTFVVHKHAARRLHYDLRLELDGVLKSWALPNGPSYDPAVKRLAVQVEDHPLDYGSFEGVIPAGEYGAGQVIIWDKGTYSPESQGMPALDNREKAQDMMRPRLEEGKVSVIFLGERLKGSWALVKMHNRGNNWLLIKHRDEFARPGSGDEAEGDTSVISGISLAELKEGKVPVKAASDDPVNLAEISGSRKAVFPSSISPMLASPVKTLFNNPDWIFEPKLDGFRINAFVRNGKTTLISRGGLDVTEQYPDVAPDLSKQKAKDLVLDGEIVMLDDVGRPCFQCLQNHLQAVQGRHTGDSKSTLSIIYYVFDVLYIDGFDVRGVPLMERKKILQAGLSPSKNVRLIEYFEGEGVSIFETAVNLGFEGVVAKKKDSLYEPGRRSSEWLKIKSMLTDDFVIAGFTEGTGYRNGTFGALLLAQYDKNGKLIFAGHVGTGFDDSLLLELRQKMDKLAAEVNPFDIKIPLNSPTRWIKPELVAEIKFAEWTQDGIIRTPVFLRLRDDKKPSEVLRVENVPPPQPKPLHFRKRTAVK